MRCRLDREKRNDVLLGVNIDHVATLREARGTDYPDVVRAAHVCERAGAEGITVHLREDRRHIRDADVYALRAAVTTPLNLEMACNEDVLAVAIDVVPDEACLVPERRAELTTEGGLDVAGQLSRVRRYVEALQNRGVLVSLFIEPEAAQVRAASECGARCIELHTGRYCELEGAEARRERDRLRDAAGLAAGLGLRVNAGHGLNRANVGPVMEIPQLHTLNIGHSILCDAVFLGLEGAVRAMREAMDGGRTGT